MSLATADLGLAVLVMAPSLLTDTARLGAGRCRAWVTADVVLSTASIYRCLVHTLYSSMVRVTLFGFLT